MRLYVIRHGETTWNTQARLQGMSDIPLNENGISLARETGEAMRDIPFTRIYTSPLKRAVQTAELVAGERQLPIVKEDRLKEISFGEWEGLSCSRDNYEIPSDSFEQFFRDPFQFTPPRGGESVMEVCRRTEHFMDELLHELKNEQDTVLLSTHGCTLRALMNYFYQDFTPSFWRGHVPPNCGVSIVEVKNGTASILEEDRIFYLGESDI
ncbi:histidine phosphatase family protein [Ruminococcus sp. OA3]|uniref:histidine phosphatase family protein n=1 Tax=Ruminococcus sp. OA3 TaxID=2914164 RepID=UPI001F054C05|nr:histidine phosphatase family protein [Ruminococcus sp. OA3]MCH1983242.1 histidine phosphatase family protein [Ruminococcus sp. OA3]